MEIKDGPSIEDGDPLVVAVTRLGGDASVWRRPGALAFRMRALRRGGEITVTRSRFDPDYGCICSMTHHTAPQGVIAGVRTAATFAPTDSVIAALNSGQPAVQIEALFDEWIKKGK